INDTGDGILLVDRANGASQLKVVESGTGTAAADLRLLGVGVDATLSGQSVQLIDGTSRYSVDLSDLDGPGENILLTSLNGGEGVDLGAFRITDSTGASAAVILNSASNPAENVADVIDAINATNIGVEARIDDSGTGILLFDTANGSGTLAVAELGGGTTAADLGLDAAVKSVVEDGELTQGIDGVGTFGQTADQSALAALVTRINSLSAGVSASTVFDGERYRLSITVDEGGAAKELLVDGAAAGLDFEEFSAAQDAVIEFGGSQSGSGVVIASSSNTFDSIVNGLSVTAVKASDETISIDVSLSTDTITEAVQDFVDAYNSIQKNLDEVTAFNETELTTGILFGTTAALRVESDLSFIVSGRFVGLGSLASLEDVGISLDDQGKLSLDKSKLEDVIADNPNALANFFTHKSLGVSAKMDTIIERLSGEDDSTLSARADTLATQIEKNSERLELMDERLAKQRDRLFNQFALLESTVARLQQSLAALDALQVIPPLSVGS
ncbi:MAG: flagellar filament capping protein FliD, partial [Pirellulales bacterium]